ncbi:response regulator [Shinella daejeonensis]|uniref:hybrid sensor histidine kinase/response regulator n=1 Tax=Shinella daejeonensis TaxID=659017 RepID=UPI0020C8060F|nr:ATP-binding protein [Shinella daejeonensis]MCP8897272.1 response regulator [Shinella daejeonensis]
MSEPLKLQNRLKTVYAEPVKAEALPPETSGAGGDAGRRRLRAVAVGQAAVPPLVAATGLAVAGLAFFAADGATGVLLAFLGLGLAGAAGWMGLRRAATAQGGGEVDHDRSWEHSETTEILSAIHDVLGDIVVMRTLDGRILRSNPVLPSLTGTADVRGRTCAELGLVFRSQSTAHRYDVDVAGPEGLRIYSWHDVTVRDPASGDLVVHSIARDVTEERLAERGRESARRKAEEASAAKSRLLATVSHEIRTPLSGMLGMSHLISQTRLTAEQKNYLAGLRQSGHALVQLVDDLLDFSALEAGRFQLRPVEDSVRPLLESVVEMLSPRAHEKGIEIGSFVAPEVPGLMTFDAPRLRQVLYNVVGNAVKFTHEGGVSLSTCLEGDLLVVRVTDTGPGMTRQEQANIFREFEQAGSAAQRSGGTGLGLAISARILSEAGGGLALESEPGRGSTFVIRMPVAQAATRVPRRNILAASRVFLLAPEGPASAALVATIEALGGVCRHADGVETALAILAGQKEPLTDIVIDNRLAGVYRRSLSDLPVIRDGEARRVYLVNPEQRGGRAIGKGEGYDAWLIRPFRERSLVDVLRGRMKGVELRDAINDNRPILKDLPPEAPEMQETAFPAAAGHRILLAEDDPVNAMLVRAGLERAGHQVRHVGDFAALESALLEGPLPDLLVTDLGMPGGDAETVVRIAAGHAGAARLPVIVLTADNREELRDALLSSGVGAVVAKPAEPQALLAEIARLARGTPS